MNKNFKYLTSVGCAILICSSALFYFYPRINESTIRNRQATDVTEPALQNGGSRNVTRDLGHSDVALLISPIFTIPLGNDRVLMGASHNVFVGRIIDQIGTKGMMLGSGRTLPITQFSVEPILNVKGNLSGTVTVEQLGGYQDGVLFASEDGDIFGPRTRPGAGYLMQPGLTYLFATRYQDDGSYYLWAFPAASKVISENSSLSDSQLQSLAENDSRVQELQTAYPNEILLADDVRTGNTRNSYASTHTPPPAPPPPPAERIVPVISSLATVVGSTSTRLIWTTNKPATSRLQFGSTTAMGENATPDTALVTNHAMLLSGLAPSTTYYYEAQSQDASGTIVTSAQQSFTIPDQGGSSQSLGGN
jgi:hypothetical protein